MSATSRSKNSLEISSERASAVVTYLKSEGVPATRWSIAGYGDSRPLSLPEQIRNNREKFDPEVLSRRIVIKVTLNSGGKTDKDVIGEAEAVKLKQRLERILPNEDEDSAPPARPSKATPRPLPQAVKSRPVEPEDKSDNTIPRTLPKKTIQQIRAERENSERDSSATVLRARPLEVKPRNSNTEEFNPELQRSRRKNQTRERLRGVEDNPPLPSVPQLRPQE